MLFPAEQAEWTEHAGAGGAGHRSASLVVCLAIGLGLLSAYVSPAAARGGTAEPQPVAVLDFSTPMAESNRWAWASGALADLLQIELDHLGLVTVDRDSIHGVLVEQRLAADPLTAPDQLKLAALLNARHLITGKILPLDNGRVRVEASAFSVEAIETVVTAASEGAFPRDLPQTVRSLAQTLAGKLKAPGAAPADLPPLARASKPESLIMFYRGLNACARGRPEIAVAWFMNASALDPDFASALLWEIKAYEMAGLAPHARLRREEAAPMLSRLGIRSPTPSAVPKDTNQPVLAVLQVAVTGDNPAAAPEFSAPVAMALKRSLLSTGKVRLFAFENIGNSLAEQDLRLSALFAREGAPRYGRWLMSDGLLLCRVHEQESGAVAVNLALIDPLSTRTVLSAQRTGTHGNLEPLVSSAARQLVGDWVERKSAGSAQPAPPLAESPLTEAETQEMRPAYQALAVALNRVRRLPADGEAHGALADAFVGTDRLRQAGEEINRRLDALDMHAPDADLTYFAVHRWVSFNVGVARPWVDAHKVSHLIDELLAAYPESLAAGCMHYNLALEAWQGGDWKDACYHAVRTRQVLQALSYTNGLEHTLIAAAFFLEGASLFKLGQLDQAETVLLGAQSFMQRFKLQTFGLTLTPSLMKWNGSHRVAACGGGQPEIATGIREQLVLIARARSGQSPPDYQGEARARLAAEIRPQGRGQDWLGCAQQLVAILERVPAQDEAQLQGVLSSVMHSIGLASFCSQGSPDHDPVLRPLTERVVSSLMQKRGIPSLAKADSVPQARLLDLAGEISRVASTAGLTNQAADTLGPLFDAPFPPAFGLTVLLRIDGSPDRLLQLVNHLAARLPGGEADVPATVWIYLAQRFSRESRYRETLECYRKAVAKGIPPAQCPGLSATLVEATLASSPARPNDQARRLCVEAGLSPFDPFWFDWYNAGRRHQQAKNYDKAIACYRTVLDFLEHSEQSGVYHLEKQPGSDRIALRWGESLGEADLTWSDKYSSRWYSAAFCLAQCLVEAGPKEEAARWLRRIAVSLGGDKVDLLEEVGWSNARYNTEPLGIWAAEMLKQLHAASPAGLPGASDSQP